MSFGTFFGLIVVLIVVIGFVKWKVSGSKRIYEPWDPPRRNHSTTSMSPSDTFHVDNINHSTRNDLK